MAKRPGARANSSSTARIPAIPLPTTTSRGRMAPLMTRSDPSVGETRRSRIDRALAQVEPPGQRQADGVEGEIDFERQKRAAGRGDRGAEAARDEVAADGADGADEAQRGGALDAGGLQRCCSARFAGAFGLALFLLAEDRWD